MCRRLAEDLWVRERRPDSCRVLDSGRGLHCENGGIDVRHADTQRALLAPHLPFRYLEVGEPTTVPPFPTPPPHPHTHTKVLISSEHSPGPAGRSSENPRRYSQVINRNLVTGPWPALSKPGHILSTEIFCSVCPFHPRAVL